MWVIDGVDEGIARLECTRTKKLAYVKAEELPTGAKAGDALECAFGKWELLPCETEKRKARIGEMFGRLKIRKQAPSASRWRGR